VRAMLRVADAAAPARPGARGRPLRLGAALHFRVASRPSKELPVHLRSISSLSLVTCLVCLAWLPACDDKKVDTKTTVTKTETKTEVKLEEKKAPPEEAKVEDAKVEDAKVEDAKVEDAKVEDAKVEDAKVDEKKAEDAKVDEKKADEKKADTKKPEEKKAEDAPKADGKDLFGKKCKSCHGPTGDAKTKIGEENDIEDWTKAGWKAKWPESKVVDIVTNGKAGTKMKPFKEKLTADEIAAVAKYARTLGK
jgi:mono/diheme cytochrome c family protein